MKQTLYNTDMLSVPSYIAQVFLNNIQAALKQHILKMLFSDFSDERYIRTSNDYNASQNYALSPH